MGHALGVFLPRVVAAPPTAQQQIDRNIKLTETKGSAMLALFKNQIAEIFRTDP